MPQLSNNSFNYILLLCSLKRGEKCEKGVGKELLILAFSSNLVDLLQEQLCF